MPAERFELFELSVGHTERKPAYLRRFYGCWAHRLLHRGLLHRGLLHRALLLQWLRARRPTILLRWPATLRRRSASTLKGCGRLLVGNYSCKAAREGGGPVTRANMRLCR